MGWVTAAAAAKLCYLTGVTGPLVIGGETGWKWTGGWSGRGPNMTFADGKFGGHRTQTE